ncbi:4'-phosphopantetheinyl transferase family protein [Streptomyces roseicoloratus]|uniref:4'-phosphopantetheinyl transferase superfamily protein n=1 Tax=Streptomyces roseicoloratus TaxID=2508722 RepID=A0ABY9RQR3_9ACTN|nr:4'-phosphopantetheinyl transferase superfamily protein [Streptomyces roseicoloratus]WMX44530.1 4'-phosphopantetheinyl transferase superfamily protein [Streptomyces roseicoloratus]
MIGRLVPDGVVAVHAFEDVAEPGDLHPEEAALIARAVDARRREFTTARWCARQALAGLGAPAAALLPGPHGAPIWPEGTLGSITHCAGFRAAVAARSAAVTALGIDAEPNAPVPDGVLEVIALPGEHRHLRERARTEPEVRWDRLLFSAKESVYKSWYPWTGQRLAFEDAALTFTLDRRGDGGGGRRGLGGGFTARILRPAPSPSAALPDRLEGRWLAQEGLLLTAITVV